MTPLKLLLAVLIVMFTVCPNALAGDFDWLRDFDIKAEADPDGFRARLKARFKIGDAEIETVISNMDKPSDVYVVPRLGEMSHKPTDVVLEKTKLNKGKGWGVIAKSLGIKPGSSEFHALKRSQDLYNVNVDKKSKSKGKSKSKK